MRSTLLFFFAIAAASAQQPRLTNARLENRTANGNFEQMFQQIVASQSQPAWIGYSVRMKPGNEQMCCWDSNHASLCSLEGRHGTSTGTASTPSTVKLEGPQWLMIMQRVENGKAGKIRAFSEDCGIDAGGLPVIWIAGVGSRESLAQLSRAAETQEDALAAIAFHEDSEADTILERLASDPQPLKLREKALFWLGTARGRRGYEIVHRVATSDPSDQLRDKAVFALFVSKEPEAVPAIIGIAKQDKSDRVRAQAIFWLSQKAGQRETAAIRNAIDQDPSTEVKKKAVFALQQLPPDQGVPLLIQVAQNNANPEVRKQAMFWLGQTHDPRATAFFEKLLTK